MHLALIILCAIVGTLAAPGDFTTLNFIASAPFTYNHKVGGGARNDKTSGTYADTVESLEGKQETCGDLVSFMLTGSISGSPDDKENYIEANVTFSGTTTGKRGVAFSKLQSFALHTETLMVENGDDGTGTNPGAGFFGIDGYVKDHFPERTAANMNCTSGFVGTIHEAGAYVWASARLGPLKPNDQFVMRFDVKLECEIPSNPTGNLQGKLDSARNYVSTTSPDYRAIPSGVQTIPMKSLSGINGLIPCVLPPNTTLINASDFKANVTITGGNYANSGATLHDFYYSWSMGGYFVSTTTPGTFSLHTFETTCNLYHGGEYLYSQSECGCEATKIGNNQPQFFVSPIGNYYNMSSAINDTIDDIPVTRYTSLGGNRTISFLYLRRNDSSIVRVNWTDGRVFTFTNVVYGPIPPSTLQQPAVPCTCRRRLDIALVIQRAGDLTRETMPYYQSFGALLVDQFSIGPNNTQMSVLVMGESTHEVSSLANGNTPTNIKNTIVSSAVTCPPTTGWNNKQLSQCLQTGTTRYDQGILEAIKSLKNTTRSTTAKPVIIVVTSSYNTAYTTQIVSAVASAEAQGISVFVLFTTLTPPVTAAQYQLVLPSKPDNLVPRYSLVDIPSVDTIDIVSRVCLSNGAPCGSTCCGACDSACGKCIPVDTCVNPPPASSCRLTNVLIGTCCQSTALVDPCPALVPSGTCRVSSCNSSTNACSTTDTCPPEGLNGDGNCYSYACVEGQCVPTPKFPPNNQCFKYRCTNNNIITTSLTCPDSDGCTSYTCNNNTGCQPSAVPNPNPSADTKCTPASCTPGAGWSTTTKCPPLADKCVAVTCDSDTGNCGYLTTQCKNATKGLCDKSACNPTTGDCEYSYVNCSAPGCREVDLVNFPDTQGCNPVTGQCVLKDIICELPCHTCDNTTTPPACPTTGCPCNCTTADKCNTYSCADSACITTPINCTATRPDFCHTPSCVSTSGCTYEPIICDPPSSPCVTVVKDPTNPLCCSEVPKDCSSIAGPCTDWGCNASRGGCYADPTCLPHSDLCLIRACNGTACVTTPRTCPSRPCYTSTCDPATGLCDSVYLCNDGNNCTDDSCNITARECIFVPKVCSSPDLCVNTSCDPSTGVCTSFRRTCNDDISCTTDVCEATTGECVFTPHDELCDQADPCLIVSCQVGSGCVNQPKTCAAEVPDVYCLEQSCVPFEGCANSTHVCNVNETIFPGKTGKGPGANQKFDCLFTTCSNANGACIAQQLDCSKDDILGVVAGSVSAGVLAAIVLAVVGFVALSGGATYAAFNTMADNDEAQVNNNPLFEDLNKSHTNPLHQEGGGGGD